MTSRALTVPTVDLKPNPPPYGELKLGKGVWDQLQARKAYEGAAHEGGDVPFDERPIALDRHV